MNRFIHVINYYKKEMESHSFNSARGYYELLLEEIALEGLDGITLEILWERLKVNPDWTLKPIDQFVEEFAWKYLVQLTDVTWYELESPKPCPRIFSTVDEYLQAITVKEFDPTKNLYPHCPIRNEKDVGSCAAYNSRVDVSDAARKLTLEEVKEKWGNRLVIVACQNVRSAILFSGNHNSIEIPDITYCILERIGRARRRGELAVSLTFIKNGANPTFYFWNKLRRKKLITCQSLFMGIRGNCSLFFLEKFHQEVVGPRGTVFPAIINSIQSTPNKARILADLKEEFPRFGKLMKLDMYRSHFKIELVPYKEFFPDSPESMCVSKKGEQKFVKVVKVIENPEKSKQLPVLDDDDDADDGENYEGFLEENRLMNRPLLSQCYYIIDQTKENGISQTELGIKLGCNKLLTRLMLRNLLKMNLVIMVSSEDARKRFYRYYSKNYSYVTKLKLEEHFQKTAMLTNMYERDKETDTTSVSMDVSTTNEDCKPDDNEKRKEATKRKLPTLKNDDVKKSKLSATSTNSNNLLPETNSVKCDSLVIELKNESLFVMRRLNIILEHVYKNQVILKMNLKKIITEEEGKQGIFQGIPDRKSLNKVINILVQAKKVKVIKTTVTEPALNKSKEIQFICIPTVDESHPIIQSSVQQVKDNLAIVYVKNSSVRPTADLKPLLVVTKKNLKYGYGPKFARMKVLHETLVYLLYLYRGDENLDSTESNEFIRSICNDFEPDEQLPRCYLKEVSWRMFIPPLMKYEEYGDGWISQNDLAERLPLKSLFTLLRLPHQVPFLEEYLRHPIKQYYLIRHLPAEMQKVIRVDKQYLYSLSLNFRNLAVIGLVQFGPKTDVRGSACMVYVNQRAMLLETTTCPPGYQKINTDIDYAKHYYDFTSQLSFETYWHDANRICVNTKLGRHALNDEPRTPYKKAVVPQRLRATWESCDVNEAPYRDTGQIPGDQLGAAGFDSSLFSHLIRQWVYSKTVQVKAPPLSPKPKTLITPIVNKKTVTKMRKMRYVLPKKPKVMKPNRDLQYDNTDLEALKKLRTLRTRWNKTEDDILILCHLAAVCYSSTLPRTTPFRVIRKLLHENSERSADKTALACKRRIYTLLKNKVRQMSVNVYLKDLQEDRVLKQKTEPIIKEIEKFAEVKNHVNVKTMTEKLIECVFRYLLENKKMVVVSAKGTSDSALPDDIETFKEFYHYEYPSSTRDKSFILLTDNDISSLIIINLILSTLITQSDPRKQINVNYLARLFQNFDDSQQKAALSYVRNHRLISFNKCGDWKRSNSYLPIGQATYHLSMTFQLFFKTLIPIDMFGQLYARYLELMSKYDCGSIQIDTCDAGLSLMLTSYFVLNKIHFDVTIPENVLFFNVKPLPEVNPEDIMKPMMKAKESYTDQTLKLIRESFFDNKDIADEKTIADGNNEMSDSDSDVEYEKEEDDTEDYSKSKITVYLTRHQFKHSDLRFSNAYDHFLINMLPVKYSVSNIEKSDFLSDADRDRAMKEIEKNLVHQKLNYTTDEIMLQIRKYCNEKHERDYAVNILEYLQQCGKCGATCRMLREEFGDLHLLRKVTDALCNSKLILRSGSKFTHYVHKDFASLWLLSFPKNTEIFVEEKRADKNESCISSTTEQRIWVQIKPWVYPNGKINRTALDSFLLRIVAFVAKWPGCSLEQVQNKFVPALQPHNVRELVEILVHLKCVKLCVLSSQEVSLFSKPFECSLTEGATGFEDESSIIIELDVNAFMKLAVFIGNCNYKDLLEFLTSDVSGAVNEPGKVEGQDIPQNSN